jgi:hypothetical protein
LEEGSKETKEAIYEIIRNQIQNNDPPDTKITYDRLLKAGKSKQEVMDLIGTVVSVEIFEILKNKTEFNKNRFVKNLYSLPRLPFN